MIIIFIISKMHRHTHTRRNSYYNSLVWFKSICFICFANKNRLFRLGSVWVWIWMLRPWRGLTNYMYIYIYNMYIAIVQQLNNTATIQMWSTTHGSDKYRHIPSYITSWLGLGTNSRTRMHTLAQQSLMF